jgi:prepilin-type N-terminal cleavage/methylation domain-containing protein
VSFSIARFRRKLTSERGFTLVELLVAMMIFGIVIVIFDAAIVSIQRAASSQDLRGQNNDQARLAIEQLDREIRSANYIYDPSTETSRALGGALTNGYALRIYGQSNASTRNPAPGYLCELWQITSSKELQVRTWPPFEPSQASAWTTVATGIVNRSVSPTVPAFALDANNPAGTNRMVDIVLLSNVSLTQTPNATVRLQLAITGRNTSFGFPSSICS